MYLLVQENDNKAINQLKNSKTSCMHFWNSNIRLCIYPLLTFSLLLFPLLLLGQTNYRFHPLNSLNSEMTHNVVFDMLQIKGLMVFGNQVDLNVYAGGKDMIATLNQPDITKGYITHLELDPLSPSPRFFVGTQNGVSSITFQNEESENFKPEVINKFSEQLSDIYVSEGFLYIARDKIIEKYELFKNDEPKLKSRDTLQFESNRIRALATISDTLYLGTEKGLFYRKIGNEKKSLIKNDQIDDAKINCLYVVGDTLWIGTKDNGIYTCINGIIDKFDPTFTDNRHENYFDESSIQTFYKDFNGTLWIGTNLGIFQLTGKELKNELKYIDLDLEEGELFNEDILSIFQSDDGVLWFGTFGGGVYKLCLDCNYNKFTNKFTRKEIRHLEISDKKNKELRKLTNLIWAIHKAPSSNSSQFYFLGTETSGLVIYDYNYDYKSEDPRNRQPYLVPIRHPATLKQIKRIRSLEVVDDQIFIGTNYGVLVSNIQNYTLDQLKDSIWLAKGEFLEGFDEIRKKNSNQLRTSVIKVIDEERKLVIGTDSGVYLYDLKANSIQFHFLKDEKVSCFYELNNKIYFGTKTGVYYYSKKDFLNGMENSKTQINNFDDYVLSINSYKDTLFFGCQNKGLSIFTPTYPQGKYTLNKQHQLTEKDGLYDKTVYSIHVANNEIYFSTNTGLYLYRMNDKALFNYRKSYGDNLTMDEFNRGAYHLDESNMLVFFGSVDGFLSFNPNFERIGASNFTPPILLVAESGDKEGNVIFSDVGSNIASIPFGNKSYNIKIKVLDYRPTSKYSYSWGIEHDQSKFGTNYSGVFRLLTKGKKKDENQNSHVENETLFKLKNDSKNLEFVIYGFNKSDQENIIKNYSIILKGKNITIPLVILSVFGLFSFGLLAKIYENTKKRKQEKDRLNNVSESIVESETPNDLLNALKKEFQKEGIELFLFGLGLFNDKTNKLEFLTDYYYQNSDFGDLEKTDWLISLDEDYFSVKCFQRGEIIETPPDNSSDSKSRVKRNEKLGGRAGSFIFYPLKFQKEIVGVFTVQSKEKKYFTKKRRSFIDPIIPYIASYASNVRFERIKTHNEKLQKVTQGIIKSPDTSGLITLIKKELEDIEKVYLYGIGIFNEYTDEIEFLEGDYFEKKPEGGLEKGSLVSFPIKNKRSHYSVTCYVEKEHVLIQDLENPYEYKKYVDEVTHKLGSPAQSLIYVPLEYRGKVIGVFTVQSKEKNAFTEKFIYKIKEELLPFISSYASSKFEQNAKEQEKLLKDKIAHNKTLHERALRAFGHDFKQLINNRKYVSSFKLSEHFEVKELEKEVNSEQDEQFGQLLISPQTKGIIDDFVVFPSEPLAHAFSDLAFLWTGKYGKESITLPNGNVPSTLGEAIEATFYLAKKIIAVVAISYEEQRTLRQIKRCNEIYNLIVEKIYDTEDISIEKSGSDYKLLWDSDSNLELSSLIMRLLYTININTLKHADPSSPVTYNIILKDNGNIVFEFCNSIWPDDEIRTNSSGESEIFPSNEILAAQMERNLKHLTKEDYAEILGIIFRSRSGTTGILFESWHTRDIINSLLSQFEYGKLKKYEKETRNGIEVFVTSFEFSPKIKPNSNE